MLYVSHASARHCKYSMVYPPVAQVKTNIFTVLSINDQGPETKSTITSLMNCLQPPQGEMNWSSRSLWRTWRINETTGLFAQLGKEALAYVTCVYKFQK